MWRHRDFAQVGFRVFPCGRALQNWNREAELKDIRGRALSTINNLFLRKYDVRSGIPDWLPGEYHQTWLDIIAEGLRPEVGANHHGIFIKRPRGPNKVNNDVPAIAPPIAPDMPTTALRRPRFYELHNDGDADAQAKRKAYAPQKVGYVDSRTKGGVTMIWVAPRDYDEE